MNKEMSLGDILQKALDRKKEVDMNHNPQGAVVADFIKAAVKTGRTLPSSLMMLTVDEMSALVNSAARDRSEGGISVLLRNRFHGSVSGLPGVFNGRPIEAIKSVRIATDAGLLEAKRFIEGVSPLKVSEKGAFALRVLFGSENLLEG